MMPVHSRRNILTRAMAAVSVTVLGDKLATAAKAAGTAASHNIEIQNLQFMPESLNVKVGDMITWTNRDIAPHTATALDKSWDIGTLKKDESKSLQVAENMAGDYVCRFHPVMKGKITIES